MVSMFQNTFYFYSTNQSSEINLKNTIYLSAGKGF